MRVVDLERLLKAFDSRQGTTFKGLSRSHERVKLWITLFSYKSFNVIS